MDRHSEIWKKTDGESDIAYKCFDKYLKLPKTRSLQDLARLLKKNICIIRKWHKTYNWEERATAFDTSLPEEQEAYDIKKMYRRHIEKAMELQNLALQKFNDIDPLTLTNSEMIRFLSAGANLEKSARKGFQQSYDSQNGEEDNYNERLQKFIDEK